MALKKIYAVFWIDDYGALKLRKKDVDWYHKNAGPISYALECDERFPWSYDYILNAKNDFSHDYLGFHYHPVRYTGQKIPKLIYDRLRLFIPVSTILRSFNLKTTKKQFRTIALLASLIVFTVVLATYLVNLWIFALSALLYCILIALAGIWYYVQRPKNWEYPMSDSEFNKKFITDAKKEYEKRGFDFPKIVRHGWNLPWADSMRFYKDLGFVADASPVTEGIDSSPHIEKRSIKWTASQPYYADLNKDYNVPWKGNAAEDKGLLELPVFLGNVSVYGFGENAKEAIAKVPEGGLVGVYIHPTDNFKPITEWVLYLKQNYDAEFISALQAFEKFSK